MSLHDARQVDQFVGALGVNVHLEYTDGKYADPYRVTADMLYLGLSNVRDAALNPANQGQWGYDVAAAAGLKFDMFSSGPDIAKTLQLIGDFRVAHPGSIIAIEGPNEVNNFPISYNGQWGDPAAVAYQAALYDAIQADGRLSDVPVYNLTSYPDLPGAATYANFHAYPLQGRQPFDVLRDARDHQAAVMPGDPLVLTEVGYHNLLGDSGVDQATQARMTLDMLFDASLLGVERTYIYELLDAYPDPGGNDAQRHFGLFNLDNTPKPVAVALHNLTTILGASVDHGGFADSKLDYQLSNLPGTAHELLLQKSTDIFDLVVWNESPTSDVAGGPSAIILDLGGLAATVRVYDPVSGAAPVLSFQNVSHIDLSLSDKPLIIEIDQGTPVSTAPAAGGGLSARSDYRVDVAAGFLTLTQNATAAETEMRGADSVHFSDGQLFVGPDSAMLYRLYDAAFGHDPTAEWMSARLNQLHSGVSYNDLVLALAAEPDFADHTQGLNDNQFVERMYLTSLSRWAEGEGEHYWFNQLQSGASRADLLNAFAQCEEHVRVTGAATDTGVWIADRPVGMIDGIYHAALGRAATGAEVTAASHLLSEGGSLADVAEGIVAASGYALDASHLGATDFVTALYEQGLHRAPDTDGLNFWVSNLDHGRDRADLVLEFAQVATTQQLYQHADAFLFG